MVPLNKKELLQREIQSLPSDKINQVLDFVLFVKRPQIQDVTLASQETLAKDWLTPQEDAAWSNL